MPGCTDCRFEFFEAIIRLAVAKYLKPGHCREAGEALETLINEHLKVRSCVCVRLWVSVGVCVGVCRCPYAYATGMEHSPVLDS